jgi:3-keto-disaccharide hydrolase
MSHRAIAGLAMFVALAAVVVASAQRAAQSQGVPAGGPATGGARSGGIPVPTITLLPGLTPVPDYDKVKAPEQAPQIPEGFVPLFNGKDLSGWHVSKTARHGRTPDFRVLHGVLLGTQQPYGQGGMLVTDRKYRNFELTLEAKPDWGCDSGIFFRATESGAAYQITMDYLGTGNGNLGRMIGEGGISLGGGRGRGAGANASAAADAAAGRGSAAGGAQGTPSAASQAWKREDWNLIRIRVEGVAPKVAVWINNQLVNEQQDAENHAPEGMVEGPIVLQVHGGTDRWVPGGFWRWRNIGIRELPN